MGKLPLGGGMEVQVEKGREGSLMYTQIEEHLTSYHLGRIHGDDSGLEARIPLQWPMMKHPLKKQRRFWDGIEWQIADVACSWERGGSQCRHKRSPFWS